MQGILRILLAKKSGQKRFSILQVLRWFRNERVNPGCLLKPDWFSTYVEHYLSAEVSLPKLIYGHNVAQLSEADIPKALDRISELVSESAGVDFNAAQADVAEVEVCQNWKLTEAEVYARVEAFQSASYPRMVRQAINDSGVTFKNRGG